jgi:hypothetical protein
MSIPDAQRNVTVHTSTGAHRLPIDTAKSRRAER